MSVIAVPTANKVLRVERPVLPAIASAPTLRCRSDRNLAFATGISSWGDLSANANHLLQATGANQPTLVASALNGFPAVRFDGTNDFLKATAFTLNQPFTVFIVYKTVALGASGVKDAIFDGNAAASAALLDNNSSTETWAMFAGGTLAAAATVSNATFTYATVQFNGNSSLARSKGVQILTGGGGLPGAGNAAGFTLGALADGTRSTQIDVAEVIIYSAAVSGADILLVEAYLSTRYGL